MESLRFILNVVLDFHLSRGENGGEGEAAGRFISSHSLRPPAWLSVSKFYLHSTDVSSRASVHQAPCAGGGDTKTDETHSERSEGDTDVF